MRWSLTCRARLREGLQDIYTDIPVADEVSKIGRLEQGILGDGCSCSGHLFLSARADVSARGSLASHGPAAIEDASRLLRRRASAAACAL